MAKKRAEEAAVPEEAPEPVMSEKEAHLREYARIKRAATDLRVAAARVAGSPFRDEFGEALDKLCRERLGG